MSYKLPTSEKLKSKKLIDNLFNGKGDSVKKFPLLLVYQKITEEEVKHQVGFSVSKRNFKKAVDRNHLKRLMREAYRLNKPEFQQPCAMMFIYISKRRMSLKEITESMGGIFQDVKISKKEQSSS